MVQTVSRRPLTLGFLAQNHVSLNGDFVVEKVGLGDVFLRWLPFSFVTDVQYQYFIYPLSTLCHLSN